MQNLKWHVSLNFVSCFLSNGFKGRKTPGEEEKEVSILKNDRSLYFFCFQNHWKNIVWMVRPKSHFDQIVMLLFFFLTKTSLRKWLQQIWQFRPSEIWFSNVGYIFNSDKKASKKLMLRDKKLQQNRPPRNSMKVLSIHARRLALTSMRKAFAPHSAYTLKQSSITQFLFCHCSNTAEWLNSKILLFSLFSHKRTASSWSFFLHSRKTINTAIVFGRRVVLAILWYISRRGNGKW